MKSRNEIKINFKIVPPNEGNVFWLFYFPLKYYNRLDLLKYWNQDYENPNPLPHFHTGDSHDQPLHL